MRPPADPSPPAELPLVDILGVRVHTLTAAEALAAIERFIREGRPRQVVTCNPEFVMAAQQDAEFRRIINSAALVIADGVGLLWAARRLGRRIPERVTGVDMLERLAECSAEQGYRLYFLGAAPGVAERTVERLQARYPRMRAVGAYSGSPAPEEAPKIIARIRRAQPDVLFVAYGAPAQDKWLARYQAELGVPVGMGVGGAFDYLAGVVPRAPTLMQRLGLEWLYRLATQPWRWRRMLALPRFAWRVLRSSSPPRP